MKSEAYIHLQGTYIPPCGVLVLYLERHIYQDSQNEKKSKAMFCIWQGANSATFDRMPM
jgi:hypothetical protein